MTTTNEPGARWLRCDLHVHTPFDRTKRFGEDVRHALAEKAKGKVDPIREIAWRVFDACREAGLELVVLTDHNAIEGYQELNPYLEEWVKIRDYSLTVLPGVELTIGGERNLHVLLIAGSDTPAEQLSDYIVSLFIGRQRHNDKGEPFSCQRSLVEFLRFTRDWFEERGYSYLLIPAHINRSSGMDSELRSAAPSTWEGELRGVLRERAFAHRQWSGFQVRGDVDAIPEWSSLLEAWAAAFFYNKPFDDLSNNQKAKIRRRQHWPIIEASDPNCSGEIGRCFTWMKMEIPDVEGIRLALIDPESRLRRMSENIPAQDHPVIRRIAIRRTDFFEDVDIAFNSCLNTLIGGRGSGKSTVIECLRYALDRARADDFEDDEREVCEQVQRFLARKEQRDYGETAGMLLPDYQICVDLEVAGHLYRVTRTDEGVKIARDPEKAQGDHLELDVRALIAPRILSQRQIARIAQDPAAQRRELDAIAGPDFTRQFKERRQALLEKLEGLQITRRNLKERVAKLPMRETELQTVKDKIELLERGGSKDILERYQKYVEEQRWLQNALSELEEITKGLENTAAKIKETGDRIGPAPEDPTTQWIGRVAKSLDARVSKTESDIKKLRDSLREFASEIKAGQEKHWLAGYQEAETKYQALQEQMEERSVSLAQHKQLLQKRAELEDEIKELQGHRNELERVDAEVLGAREKLVQLHGERQAKRMGLAASGRRFRGTGCRCSARGHTFWRSERLCQPKGGMVRWLGPARARLGSSRGLRFLARRRYP